MEKKKALIINASPHSSGPTATVLGTLENRLAQLYEIERVDLGARAITPCTGCARCRPDGRCVLPRDEATELGEKIAQADLLAIGTPCYWGNIPSTLKAVFDRNVTTFEHFLKGTPTPKLRGKKAIVLVTAGSPFPYSRLANQAGGTLRAIRTPLESGGIRILGTRVFSSAWKLDAAKAERSIARIRIR
jgi:putative NADPH-quinone reductase